jgi:hypothetical protein
MQTKSSGALKKTAPPVNSSLPWATLVKLLNMHQDDDGL